MARGHRRPASHGSRSPIPPSPSTSGPSHTTTSPQCDEQQPSLAPSISSDVPNQPTPAPPPFNYVWLGRDAEPAINPTETVKPQTDEAIPPPTRSPSPSRSLTLPPEELPSPFAQDRPASELSCASEGSDDSGVLLHRPSSKSSHVTSISIPPSTGSTRAYLAPQSPLCPPLTCHAPIPRWKFSPLENICPKATRHSQFYFPDDLITLKVDRCLFRIHKGFLERESTYFKKLFGKEAGRGVTDDTAIELPQVTEAAFETMLRFIYFGMHEPCSYPVEDWISLLAASTSLCLPRIRERALSELERDTSCLDAIDRLLLADRYDIDRWRAPAYVELCVRDRPIQESEATLLGVKVTSQLAEIRERVLLEMLSDYHRAARSDKFGIRALTKPVRDVRRVEQLVDEVFWPHEVPISCRA